MPRGDRTGPLGEGPLTGRGAGYCAGYPAPGFANRPVPGYGAFQGSFGGGRSRGGFGYRHRFYATGIPLSAYAPTGLGQSLTADEEIALLKSESKRLRSVLEGIEKRLAQLETE